MPWATFRELNPKTLEGLDAARLCGSAEAEDLAGIRDEWPFPLWPLERRVKEVKFEDMRTARESLAAKYPDLQTRGCCSQR